MTLKELIEQLTVSDIRLSFHSGDIHYDAPSGGINDDIIEAIATHHNDLIEWLDQSTSSWFSFNLHHSGLTSLYNRRDSQAFEQAHLIEIVEESPPVSAEEAQFLVHELNETESQYVPDLCFIKQFQQVARANSNAVAVRYRNEFEVDYDDHDIARINDAHEFAANNAINGAVSEISYAELNSCTEQVTRFFKSRNIKPGDVIMAHIGSHSDLIIALLATLKLGAVFLPVSVHMPLRYLARIIEDNQPQFILTELATKKRITAYLDRANVNVERVLVVDCDSFLQQVAQCAEHTPAVEYPALASDAPQLLFYDYDNNGLLKRTEFTQRNIANSLATITETYLLPHVAGSVVFGDSAKVNNRLVTRTADNQVGSEFGHIEQHFQHFILSILGPLSCGKFVDILPASQLSEGLPQLLFNNHQPLCFFLHSKQLQMLTDIPVLPVNAATQHVLNIFGSDVATSHLHRWVSELLPSAIYRRVFGCFEIANCPLLYHIDKKAVLPNSKLTIPVGRPTANTRAFILDDDANLVPFGAVGTLYIAGDSLGATPSLDSFYFSAQRSQFAEVSFPDNTKQRMLCTGMQAKYQELGNIELV